MISASQLASLIADQLLHAPQTNGAPLSEIVIDSREATPRCLFVALPGERLDGHRFVDHALSRGAAAALVSTASGLRGPRILVVDDPLTSLQEAGRRWRNHVEVQVVGITGSVGKTTVREAVWQLLSQHVPTHQSPRNFNGDIGLPIALLGIAETDKWAVIEIGPYSQEEMELLVSSARADIGIVTNVGPTHLERFGTLDDTERIKGLLPASLPVDGLAVLNGDDERVRRMSQRAHAEVRTFGISAPCDLQAIDIVARGFDGIEFTLIDQRHQQRQRVSTPLIGAHQAMTAMAASAVGLRVGLDLPQIAKSLGNLPPGSRLVRRTAWNGAVIIDDSYNAAPLSMQAALDLLQDCAPRRVALLGDMYELGGQERSAHRQIGRYASDRCDWLIAVGKRSQDIAAAAREAGHRHAYWVAEAEQAVEMLRQSLSRIDTLLVKASHALRLDRVVERLSAS